MNDDLNKKQAEHMNTVNWAQTLDSFVSPSKMLVESATMIFIIAFMLFCGVGLVWKGDELSASQMMLGFFGLLFTMSVAIRQFASFRY
jgi:ABC-type multidrug transport system fused ATPase/permease subunit